MPELLPDLDLPTPDEAEVPGLLPAVMSDNDVLNQIARRPNDKEMLRRCMESAAPGDAAAGLDWAAAMQASYPLPLWSVLDALATRDGDEAVRQRFATLFETASAGEMAPVQRSWEALLDRRAIDPGDAPLVAADRRFLVPCFFRFMQPKPRMLPLRSIRAPDVNALTAAGILAEPMRNFLETFLACDPRWAEMMQASPMPSPEGRERVLRAESDAAWVDRTLATGRLTMLDPLTGEPCDANDSLIAFGRGIYRFDGQEPFFMLTGGPWNAPQGIYMPKRHLVLHFSGEWRGVLEIGPVANLLSSYLRRRAAPASTAPEGPAGFTLYLPPTDNFAHQHWNFHTGVERSIRLGRLNNVAAVRFSGTEFFGTLLDIFPELQSVRIERPRREAVIDPAPNDPTRLVLPSGGFFIPRTLTERIIGLMRRLPRSRPDLVEPNDVPRGPGAPVIWLALRVRGRAWVGQEQGFAHIIRYILARRPDAVFLLDGFSFPVGSDGTTHQWVSAVQTLEDMADRVIAAAPPGARIVRMIGNTMRESVLWAAESHAYLCPYGTTQHKVAWFSSAPGIVYAPPAFSLSQTIRSPGFSAAEISALPRLIIGKEAIDHAPSVGPARILKGSTANLTLDPAEIAAALWQLLEERFPAISSDAGGDDGAASRPAAS